VEHLVIWDWKRGQLLFELEEDRGETAEFIDDYRLLVNFNAWDKPPFFVLVDTEKVVGEAPMRTTFHLSPHLHQLEQPSLLLERGVHEPSPAESFAPFYQDPTQRIAALFLPFSLYFIVFRVGALLELLKNHEGSEIGWDEWKELVVSSPIDHDQPSVLDTWVSGCRLFCIFHGLDAEMILYDFSIQRRANHLSEQVDEDLGGVRYMLPTDASAQVLGMELIGTHTGHGNIALSNWVPYRDTGDPNKLQLKCVFQIWTF